MRLLLDESLPVELSQELEGHDVSTVRDQRWLGLRNGVLLRAAVGAGFQVIITADQRLRYQQNLPRIGIAAVVITRVRNRISDLRPLIPQILDALQKCGWERLLRSLARIASFRTLSRHLLAEKPRWDLASSDATSKGHQERAEINDQPQPDSCWRSLQLRGTSGHLLTNRTSRFAAASSLRRRRGRG